jgi:hypothetical protein
MVVRTSASGKSGEVSQDVSAMLRPKVGITALNKKKTHTPRLKTPKHRRYTQDALDSIVRYKRLAAAIP